MEKHSFFNHIFPQITKFFAFYKNAESKTNFVEKLYSVFENDKELRDVLKEWIGKKEVFKFLKDLVDNSQNILLIIDDSKKELPEITETYTDTWGKMVKVAILKEFICQNSKLNSILTLSPNFENIETIDIVTGNESDAKSVYDENFHIDGISKNTLSLYNKLKEQLLSQIPSIQFNPQRYYISLRKKRNFAFLQVRKSKIGLTVILKEEKVRERVKNYDITSLTESVQKFYNGACARIELTNDKHLNEVIDLLVEIQK